MYVWGREGKEARAAVGVTKGVRGGEHQRKHIRIVDPPPLCLLSLSLSLSPDWILFILPRNSTALLLFRDYTDLNPRRAVLREGGDTYPPVNHWLELTCQFQLLEIELEWGLIFGTPTRSGFLWFYLCVETEPEWSFFFII